jgi:hypothetical protein
MRQQQSNLLLLRYPRSQGKQGNYFRAVTLTTKLRRCEKIIKRKIFVTLTSEYVGQHIQTGACQHGSCIALGKLIQNLLFITKQLALFKWSLLLKKYLQRTQTL